MIRRLSSEAVAAILRGQPGVESIFVEMEDSQVMVTLRLAQGEDAYEAVCRAIERVHARMPRLQVHVIVASEESSGGSR